MNITCNISISPICTFNDGQMLIYENFLSEIRMIEDDVTDEIDDFDATIELNITQMKDVIGIVKLLQKYRNSFKKLDGCISVRVNMRF